jgi:hypothetical protein
VLRAKREIQVLRVLPDQRGNVVSQALKGRRGLQGQREKKAIMVLRVLPDRRVREANRVFKDRRDQRGKKAIMVLRAFPDHRGNMVSLGRRGCRDQRGIPPIPARCSSLKTAFPNWKRDSRRQAKSFES